MEEQTEDIEQTDIVPVPYEEPSDDSDDDEDDGPRFTETNLSFHDFLLRLPHPKVVRACGLALRNFETNSPSTNHSILKLLHRIAFDCKMYVMVFQLSIFKTFQRILSMKDMPQYKELAKFATYILRQFFKLAETNKTIFVETLFWKSKRDAYEIENGYGSLNEKSKAASTFWSEEQEDELRRLFMEHQNNKIEEDIVDWIVNNLVDNTRTRRAVLKKLKEMYLLVDHKQGGGRKSGTKVPATWGAEEEEQLRELYEEFKDAMDPLGCIAARLEVPRPKNRIVEKLLVLGLIQDRKEVYKKRARKSGPRKSRRADSSNSDSDSDNATPRPTLKKPKKPSVTVNERTKKVYTQRKKNQVVVEKRELVARLVENSEAGRNEALNWLKESISDAIEDLQDGFDEGIPLVPIMDYAQEAVENEDFKKLLNALGICEPFDEQEMYWRIPTHLSVSVLEEHCTLIQQALDGTLTVPIIEETIDSDNSEKSGNEGSPKPSGSRDVQPTGRAKKSKRSFPAKEIPSGSNDSGSNESGNEGSPKPSGSRDVQPTSSSGRAKKSRRPISDKEIPSGSNARGSDEDSDKENNKIASKPSRVRSFFVYSSDDEMPSGSNEPGLDKDSDKENNTIASKPSGARRFFDYSSDENSDKENSTRAKKRNIIQSDSEEENGRTGDRNGNNVNSDSEDEGSFGKRPLGSDSEKAPTKKRRIVDSDDGE